MRAAWILVAVVAAAGCVAPDLDFSGRTFDLQSDTGTLTIDACAVSGLLACTSSTAIFLAAVLDGVRTDLPARQPGVLELFPEYDHELVVPSPTDPNIALISAQASTTVEELPWFALDVPVDPIARAPIDVTFQRYPDAVVAIELNTTCDDGTAHSQPFTTTDDTIRLTFPTPTDPTSTCTHELRVTQTLDVANDVNAIIHVGRLERPLIITTP